VRAEAFDQFFRQYFTVIWPPPLNIREHA
jgi:hypothetical protein